MALAKLVYQRYLSRFEGPEFAELLGAGARPQQLLWASTGTKNPAYDDLLYVEPLIGKHTVNTLPDATFAALRDHGKVGQICPGPVACGIAPSRSSRLGIDMNAVGETLKQDGLIQLSRHSAPCSRQLPDFPSLR